MDGGAVVFEDDRSAGSGEGVRVIGAGVTTARPPHAPAPASQTAPTVRPTGDRGGGPVPPRWQRNVWRALWRNAGPAVVAGLLVAAVLGAVGGILGAQASTTYTSTTTMMIDDAYQLAAAGSQGEMLKLNTLLIKYAGLVSTDAIAQPVATELGLSLHQVLRAVTAQANGSTETLLLPVAATWSTPAEAVRLSQAVADELIAYVKAQDVEFHIPAKDRFTFITVNPASAAVASGTPVTKAATDALGLAVVGFALAFVGVQLVRNRDELTA